MRVVIVRGIWVLLWLISSVCHVFGDDPLNARPTVEESVQIKLSRVSGSDLDRLKVPVDAETAVLRISLREVGEQDVTSAPVELFCVFADRRIVAKNYAPMSSKPSSGSISQDELRWLVHLVVNECLGLSRTTKAIQSEYDQIQQAAAPMAWFQFDVCVQGKQNSFDVPYDALQTRPLRRRLSLDSFASLLAFTNYLTARNYLGGDESQRVILQRVNEKLRARNDNSRRFQIEDLISAGNSKGEISAVFAQRLKTEKELATTITAFYVTRNGQRDHKVEFESIQRASPATP